MSDQWRGTTIRSFERSIWRLATFSYTQSHLYSGHQLLFWSRLEGKNWKWLHLVGHAFKSTLAKLPIETLLAHCRRIARSRFHWGWSQFKSQIVALCMAWSDHPDSHPIFPRYHERMLAVFNEVIPHWCKHRKLFPFVVGFWFRLYTLICDTWVNLLSNLELTSVDYLRVF